MQTVAEVMTKDPVTVGPEDSAARAAILMERFKVGGLPVVEEGRLVGIITSRDLRRSHPNRLVVDVMNKEVVTVPPECSIWEAKEILEQHGIERLVVVKDGCVLGVVTKSYIHTELGKHVDALTGLPRGEFLKLKALELLEGGREIAVVFIDLDNFGKLNKELGHVVGDEILRITGRLLSEILEDEIDYLCRYAGDEFALITVRPLKETKELAYAMVARLAEQKWPYGIRVTGSAGIAGGRRRSVRIEQDLTVMVNELINMASLASTRAKKEGKTVVVVGYVELTEAI